MAFGRLRKGGWLTCWLSTLFRWRRGRNIFLAILTSFLIVMFFPSWSRAASFVVMGDYAAAPRIKNHVDSTRLVARLRELGANTYMWLVWRGENDWDDLKLFLPKAEDAGISVWVYLVPPSETALQDGKSPYSEPYRIDYIRWAEEIAKLSLSNSNLRGYVIDDFWGNVKSGSFSSEYMHRVVDAGKSINPKIKFYPLMYFDQVGVQSTKFLAPFVDGVVGAYPRNREVVLKALTYLEDRFVEGDSIRVAFPQNRPSKSGDHGMGVQRVRVTDSKNAKLEFHYSDNFDGSTKGFRQFQVLIDGQVIWSEDVEGHDDDDASIDLSKYLSGKDEVTLGLGVADLKGVGNFKIESYITQIKEYGVLVTNRKLKGGDGWSIDASEPFNVSIEKGGVGLGKVKIPLIVMAAGDAAQFQKRFLMDGSPENISGGVRFAADLAREGRIEGVVTYCLDKSEGSRSFSAVKEVFESNRR